MKRVTPRIGDIVEIKTPKGLAYVQYTARHTMPPGFGELVRVLPGLHKKRPADFSALAQSKENYFVFTPLGFSCRQKQATIVANETVPDCAKGIPLMRMANTFDENGKGHNWDLWDGTKTWPATGAPQELNKLSIASIWGHEILIERLAEGWLPSDEPVDDPSSGKSQQLSSFRDTEEAEEVDSDNLELREVRHYLYFPTAISAKHAAEMLKAAGYLTYVGRSRGQNSWLLQVTAHAQLDEKQLKDAMTYLKRFATSKGGEYDGWDVLTSDTS